MNFQKFSPLLSAAAFLAASDFSSGQSIRWIGTGGAPGDFNDGANWAGGVVPGPLNQARFQSGGSFGTVSLTASGPTEIESLRVRTGASVSIVSGDGSAGSPVLNFNRDGLGIVSRGTGSTLTMSGSYLFSNTGTSQGIWALGGGTANLIDASLDSGGSDSIQLRADGTITVTDSNFLVSQDVLVSQSVPVELNGVNTIDGGGLTLGSEATIELSPGDVLDVNGGSVEGGTWVLDLGAGGTGSDFIEAVNIDITDIHLDLTGNVTGSGPGNPRVLATYSGTLTQNGTPEGFASVTGLPSGLRLSFDNGQIAIVPEMSLAAPILAGFLPLVAFRRRKRK